MSSVRRKPGTRFWFACFTDGDGIQRQRSTKTTVKRDAERMAEAFEEAYRKKQSESQMRRVMSDIHVDLFGAPLQAYTLGQYVEQWFPRVRGGYRPGTVERIESTLASIRKTAPNLMSTRIEQITRRELIDLRNELAKTRAISTVKTMMQFVKGIFRSAWQDGIISDNPAGSIPSLKPQHDGGQESGRRAFTQAELKAVLRVANKEWADMILVGLYTAGQRLGDVCRLTPDRVDLKSMTIKFKAGKTRRWMVIPIASPIAPILRRRLKGLKSGDYLFPEAMARIRKSKSGSSVGEVSNSFRRLLSRAGLATNPSTTKAKLSGGRRSTNELSYHSLRHTATSMLKSAGVAGAIVMDLVGHESEAVNEHYTKIDEATKRSALDRLPSI